MSRMSNMYKNSKSYSQSNSKPNMSMNAKNAFVKNQANKLTNVVLSDQNFPALHNANIAVASSLNFIEKIKFEPVIEIKTERNPEYIYYTTRNIPVKKEPENGKPKWAHFGPVWELETVTAEPTDCKNPDFSKMVNHWNKYKTTFISIYGEDCYDDMYKYPYEETFEEEEEEE